MQVRCHPIAPRLGKHVNYKRRGTIYEDVTSDVLGKIGVWQCIVVAVLTVMTFPAIFNGYEDMFLLQSSGDVKCIPQQKNELINSSSCTVISINNSTELVKCTKWHVKLFWLIWLQKSWNLFCGKRMNLLSTTIICRMGLMFGSVMFGVIADSSGRKVAITIHLFAQLIFGVIIIFCDSQAWFQLLVFLKSLFGCANTFIAIIIACELSSNPWRTRILTIVSSPRLLSIICIVPFANAMPNLETLNFIAILFYILLVILLRWTPESTQWLLFNRNILLAENIIIVAARKNGIELCNDFKIRPVDDRAYNCLDETRTCGAILAIYNIRVLILVSLSLWSLFFFRWSYFFAKTYTENREPTLHMLLCFVVMFAVLTGLLSKKVMMRHLLLFNIILFGGFTSTEMLFGSTTAPYLFASMALASGLIVQALLLNITPRVFATKIRATLVGCCHAVGQLGTMLGYLLYIFQPLNSVIFVAMELGITLILIILCLILVNIDGRELPDMIDDMDYFSELSKPLRWVTQKTNSPSNEELEMRIHSFETALGHSDNDLRQHRIPARRIGLFKQWKRLVDRFRDMFLQL